MDAMRVWTLCTVLCCAIAELFCAVLCFQDKTLACSVGLNETLGSFHLRSANDTRIELAQPKTGGFHCIDDAPLERHGVMLTTGSEPCAARPRHPFICL